MSIKYVYITWNIVNDWFRGEDKVALAQNPPLARQ